MTGAGEVSLELTANGSRLLWGKRLSDIVLVILASPLLMVLFVVTYAIVRVRIGNPVYFRQARAGQGGRTFYLTKFRTMTNARGADGELLPDEQRHLPIGRQLRRFRLDELPSFLQVLTGDISLVGPRPLWWQAIDSHPQGVDRLAGPPGFTGLAQVSGNTLLTDSEKFAIDCLYLKQRNWFGDLAIMIRTITTLVIGERRNEKTILRARMMFPYFFVDS